MHDVDRYTSRWRRFVTYAKMLVACNNHDSNKATMRFNIRQISILSFLILAVTFICTGNGNRLVAVTDEVEEEAVYNRKEYHDLNTEGNDFGYDANGNLIYD